MKLTRWAVMVAGGVMFPGMLYAGRFENDLAQTPPMGWSSWNRFQCDITEDIIKGIADAMVASGMREAGYEFVNIDDCWEAFSRDSNGDLTNNPTTFPSGMAALGEYIHDRGLKYGIYTGVGWATCAGRPGSGGNYQRDVNKFAAWGVDYIKLDWCTDINQYSIVSSYAEFADCILNTGRPIVYSICLGPEKEFPYLGNLWRIGGDIMPTWTSILDEIRANANLYDRARPGHWNDPDMLQVGNGTFTETENRAHFSMWCIMAAPLIAGNDLRTMNETVRSILTAPEPIAINQDLLGYQGRRIGAEANQEIWRKKLRNGDWAVALFNKGSSSSQMTVTFSSVWETAISGHVHVRDSWSRQSLGWHTTSFSTTVPSHGVALLRLSTAPDTIAPGPVSDLSVEYVMTNAVRLAWSAPGNDGAVGQAVKYDIRFATFPISSESDWRAAMPCLDEPRPALAGSRQSFTVTRLRPGRQYWFAMRTRDDIPNESILSNVVTATTENNDTIAPSAISDLVVQQMSDTTITLHWTAVGDDASSGRASHYDIRYATFPITDSNSFLQARRWSTLPEPRIPAAAGTAESCTIEGLIPNVRYYIAIRTGDEVPNWSFLSNVASATTQGLLWQSQDIGTVGVPGSFTLSSGVFTVRGSGADIYGVNDSFRFVYVKLRGEGAITARLVSMQNTDSWAKVGVMIRERPEPSSAYAMTVLTPGQGAVFQIKEIPPMEYNLTIGQQSGIAAPYWLRVRRSSYYYISEISPNGMTWTRLGQPRELFFLKNKDVYVGLVVCSHNNSQLNTAVFDNVSVTYGDIVVASTAPANIPPVCTLTSPVAGSTYTAPATINLAATASDSDGSVVSVAFYRGTTLLFTDTSSPYSYSWTGVSSGTYQLSAVATDNQGGTGMSGVVTVMVVSSWTPVSQPPVVALTSPVSGSTYPAPAVINLAATASDPDGTIAVVRFYAGTTLLNLDTASPYAYTWANVSSGTYALYATAQDNQGLVSTSAVSNVTVLYVPPNQAPVVTLTNPPNNSTYTAPATILLAATASDSDGHIINVRFYRGGTLLGSVTASPYEYAWTNVSSGTYQLRAVAQDNAGATSTSTVVTVTVLSSSTPAVWYTLTTQANPAAGGTISPASGTYLAGSQIQVTATPNPNYVFVNWSRDATGTSPSITITMDSDKSITANFTYVPPANSSPTVSITSPVDGTVYTSPATISIAATALDSDGSITVVRFYAGTTLLGVDSTSPYAYTWTNVGAGSYFLSAQAEDNQGAVGVSVPVGITVTPAAVVTYSLTVNVTPAGGGTVSQTPSGTVFSSGTVVSLTATPNAGYVFAGWSGAVTSTSPMVTIVMDGDKTLTATFQETTQQPVQPVLQPGEVRVVGGPNGFINNETGSIVRVSFRRKTTGMVTVRLYDLRGRLLLEKQRAGADGTCDEIEINVVGLPSGVYLVQTVGVVMESRKKIAWVR